MSKLSPSFLISDNEYLKKILEYNPETGEWIWLISPSPKIKTGTKAGGTNNDGYVMIKINKKLYKSSILAWLYMTGKWPELEIDHKDRISHNDIWNNLREATRSEQNINKGMYSNNKSGTKGVHWDKRNDKWCAQIRIKGKVKFLGYFDKIEDAIYIRKLAEKEYY
jgi:hypothetical protein